MSNPQTETAVEPAGWLQTQVYELKAQVSQLEQQLEHLRSMTTDVSENLGKVEVQLHATAMSAAPVPRVQEEINQAAALIVQLQDQQADTNEKVEVLGRRRLDEGSRGQEEWTDIVRRVDQVERQVASWQDRQAGVDEVGRRFQEEVSIIRQQLLHAEQRLEGSENRAARGLESATRAEHTLTQVEASILALRREDETIAERARVAVEVAHRLEGTLNQQLEDLQRMDLLAERIELHRAERQRLEELARRLEEEVSELRNQTEQQTQQQGLLSTQQHSFASRLDAFQEEAEERGAALLEQLRKLTSSQSRTKRRQIQELEREIREMKQYVASVTDE